MIRPTALLYDWDDTLADGWAGITAAMNAALVAHGLPAWTVEQTRARARRSLREAFPDLFGAGWEQARDIFYAELHACHLAHLRPKPGAAAALAAGARWPQAVVSNKAGAVLRREVLHLGWRDHFGAVIGAGDAAADKPDAAPLYLALDRIGVAPSPAVWYVGDTALDMQAARAAGCTALLLGDASHDGGVGRAAPDMNLPDADALTMLLCSII